ncbi:hypothetical protein ALC60_14581 [Trachymyrmex zeteki]|uniref:Uncharacterized protein n=1 Tax=Mycetomoellerius zeteki TaxID=64791 RepID=A0A151WF55_9HYME|nr:hypothetical protein ALC60_14581 [Trachymyrmex zeteki]
MIRSACRPRIGSLLRVSLSSFTFQFVRDNREKRGLATAKHKKMRIRAVLDRNGYHVTDGGNEIILADMESVASRKFQRHHQFKFAGRKGK